MAGGHLGFHKEQLEEFTPDIYGEEVKKIITVVQKYEEKYEKKIPVILAGGIYDHADYERAFSLGADGVQIATRFVTTEECDADEHYKQTYIQAEKEDIVIVKSPVGMPGRAIRNTFLDKVKSGYRRRNVFAVFIPVIRQKHRTVSQKHSSMQPKERQKMPFYSAEDALMRQKQSKQ